MPQKDKTASKLTSMMQSRRVLISLASLLVSVILVWLPELMSIEQSLTDVIVTLLLVFVGGYTVSDGIITANRSTTKQMKGDDLAQQT